MNTNTGPDSGPEVKRVCKTCYWATYYPVAENDRMMWCDSRKELIIEEPDSVETEEFCQSVERLELIPSCHIDAIKSWAVRTEINWKFEEAE